MRFVDTNVLLYAVSTAPAEAEKTAQARQLLESEDLALSVQVLQEFYVQATRASRTGRLTHEQASTLVEAFQRYPVLDVTAELMRTSFDTADRFGISYWDAAIIEAARRLGCKTLLSEDLADGQTYDGVTVENPFRRPSRSPGAKARTRR